MTAVKKTVLAINTALVLKTTTIRKTNKIPKIAQILILFPKCNPEKKNGRHKKRIEESKFLFAKAPAVSNTA